MTEDRDPLDDDDSVGLTDDPDASHPLSGEEAPRPLPFPARVIACFLAVDAAERTFEIVSLLRADPDVIATSAFARPYVPSPIVTALWILVDLLLAFLLVLGTRFGRLCTLILFGVHMFYVTLVLSVRAPQLWLYASPWGRISVALTVLVDFAAILYLVSPQARERFDS